MDGYDLVKYIHVVAAITAVGLNLSYGAWLALTARTPEHRLHVLRGIQFLDDWAANPAYVLLLLSGSAMLAIGSIPITTTWVLIALVLYAVLVVLGLGVFSRALRRQIRYLEEGSGSTAAYDAVARKTTLSGLLLVTIALVIVFLMVTKPGA
jgi:uncharacterized membrane protein